MSGRSFKPSLLLASAIAAILAVVRLAGIDPAGPLAAGAAIGAGNLAVMWVVYGRITAPEPAPFSRILWCAAAVAKFGVLMAVVYAAVAVANLDPGLLAAGFTAAIAAAAGWTFLEAIRAAREYDRDASKGPVTCRTE